MRILTENPMLMISVIVFILCVIIGFFGDRYLRSKNKIGKILDVQKKDDIKSDVNFDEPSNNQELKENNSELITSENINSVSNVENVMAPSDTTLNASDSDFNIQMPNQTLNPKINEQSINEVDNFNLFANDSNNLNQEVSEPIAPEQYPPENNPQNVMGMPTPFDGQINNDDNINNIF